MCLTEKQDTIAIATNPQGLGYVHMEAVETQELLHVGSDVRMGPELRPGGPLFTYFLHLMPCSFTLGGGPERENG